MFSRYEISTNWKLLCRLNPNTAACTTIIVNEIILSTYEYFICILKCPRTIFLSPPKVKINPVYRWGNWGRGRNKWITVDHKAFWRWNRAANSFSLLYAFMVVLYYRELSIQALLLSYGGYLLVGKRGVVLGRTATFYGFISGLKWVTFSWLLIINYGYK